MFFLYTHTRHTRLCVTYFFILATLLCSCHGQAEYPSLLLQADSAIIHGDYHRADSLINAYSIAPSKRDSATASYFQLLQLEYKLVNDDLSETDYDIADKLSRYYKQQHSKEKQAIALLLIGELHKNADDFQTALEKYMEADELTYESQNFILKGWVYQMTGDLHYLQNNNKECTHYYHRYFQCASKVKDTLRMAQAAHRMAISSMMENSIDSTIYYCNFSMNLAKHTAQPENIIPYVKYLLCDLYNQTGNPEQALSLLSYEPIYYPNWGYYYLNTNHLDSAAFYFKKALSDDNINQKRWHLHSLAEIESAIGNLSESIEYYNQLMDIIDSIEERDQRANLSKVKMRHSYKTIQKIQETLLEKEEHFKLILYSTFAIVIILLLGIHRMWKIKISKKNREILKERLLRKEKEEQYKNSVHQLEDNNQRIAQLERELSDARENNDLTMVSQLLQSTQLLKIENKHIEAALQHKDVLIQAFLQSSLYKRIKMHSEKDAALSEEDWNNLADHVNSISENFTTRLLALANLSETEMRICYLVKLEIQPTTIASLLFKTKSAITMSRYRLYYKITGKKGTAKQLDDFILSF